jgi:hypothetical protein
MIGVADMTEMEDIIPGAHGTPGGETTTNTISNEGEDDGGRGRHWSPGRCTRVPRRVVLIGVTSALLCIQEIE